MRRGAGRQSRSPTPTSGRRGYIVGSQEWRTPPEFFKQLDDEFHFTLDVAASHENALCKKYCTLEGTFDEWDCNNPECATWHHGEVSELDGLNYDWAGQTVFCNPPYSDVRPWVERASEHQNDSTLSVLLLAPSVDAAWWHDFIWDGVMHRPYERIEVRFLRGRIRFVHPDPEKRETAFKGFRPIQGNVVVVFRPYN
jgi:hypothetical protein